MSQGSTDNSIGNTGAVVPAQATQVGGTDGTDLRAIKTDGAGRVNTFQEPNVDAGNSTTATLGGAGVFTGTGLDVSGYAVITVAVFTDQAGTLQLQFSSDNANWDFPVTFLVVANTGQHVEIGPQAKFFRVVYTNGATPQGVFRLQTIEKRTAAATPVVSLSQAVDPNGDALLTKSSIVGKTTAGGGSYVDVKVNPSGALTTETNMTQIGGSNITTQAAGEQLVAVEGRAASGAALAGNPVLVAGSDGANAQIPRLFDLDTGGGTQFALGVNLRRSAAGGSQELLGQTTKANSVPVTLASDQGAPQPATFATATLNALNTAVTIDVRFNTSASIAFQGGGTLNATVAFEASQDFANNWFPVNAMTATGAIVGSSVARTPAAAAVSYGLILPPGTTNVRARVSVFVSGAEVAEAFATANESTLKVCVGAAADGSAAIGNPVLVGGTDGSGNAQSVFTNTDGTLEVIHKTLASAVHTFVGTGDALQLALTPTSPNFTTHQTISFWLQSMNLNTIIVFEATINGVTDRWPCYPVMGTLAPASVGLPDGQPITQVNGLSGQTWFTTTVPVGCTNFQLRCAAFNGANAAQIFATSAPPVVTGAQNDGIEDGFVVRPIRAGKDGTLRSTSEIQLWHDAFEGATINAFWTQSTTTQTIVQAAGVLTLNNSGITTLNTGSLVTSQRQFAKYPDRGLHAKFRCNISANVAGNHTQCDFGLAAPSSPTLAAAVPNGAFFRWQLDGSLAAILAYNSTETVAQVLPQGQISTANYYDYDIVLHDNYARFIVVDSNGTPIVDRSIRLPVARIVTMAVSHISSFARVSVDATGGGTIVKLNISEHHVDQVDGLIATTMNDQMAFAMRHGSINPTSYAQTGQLAAGAAPGAFTPSNTVAGNATLGGEAQVNSTATSENLLSIFAFTIPTPYSYMLNGVFIPRPIITTALTTTACILEWFLIANCATGNISTGGGQRVSLGLMRAAASAAAATALDGSDINWQPRTPIVCLPGTVLHFGWKMILGAATGVLRVVVNPDGYFN